MIQLSALYVYPIKSLGGFPVDQAIVTDRGLQYDRRWMLVDEGGNFLSQRKLPQMALLQTSIGSGMLTVRHKTNGGEINIPLETQSTKKIEVTVWDNRSTGIHVSEDADDWFSEQLGVRCRLVYMPDEAPIHVDPDYAHNGEINSFSDGYPFLLIGQSSLDDLNSKLAEPVPMNRFRPNIVVTGAAPFAEDGWKQFTIGGIQFLGVKKCGRCVVTTINQDNLEMGQEPLKTLATYRQQGKKINFGQNLLHRGTGMLRVGDAVEVKDGD